MENDQFVATKGSPPVAFAARNENDWAQLVREPIGVLPSLTEKIGAFYAANRDSAAWMNI